MAATQTKGLTGNRLMDRRNPYRPFDPSLIQDFLRGREIVTAELMPTGKSNTNYKLTLNDGHTYLLRLYSHGRVESEIYAMNLVKDLVPVPLELERGETWAIFPFLEGQLLADVPEYVGVVAEALAKISSIMFESPGMIEADGSIWPFPFQGFQGFIRSQLENPVVQAALGQKLIEVMDILLQKETWRLDELNAESHLVHGDFNPTNILIHQGAVSGVLDWEFCHSGSPYMDVGNLLRHTEAARYSAVQRGLEAGGIRLPADWVERAELVDMTSHLEFLTSGRSEAFKQQCVTRIERFVSKFQHNNK